MKGLPYPSELRSKAIAEVLAGLSCRDVAARYGISRSAVGKWVLRFQRSGNAAAKPVGGDRFSSLKCERDWLLDRMVAAPDLTPTQLHHELRGRGVHVGYRTVEMFIRREKVGSK
jgi:transposase